MKKAVEKFPKDSLEEFSKEPIEKFLKKKVLVEFKNELSGVHEAIRKEFIEGFFKESLDKLIEIFLIFNPRKIFLRELKCCFGFNGT